MLRKSRHWWSRRRVKNGKGRVEETQCIEDDSHCVKEETVNKKKKARHVPVLPTLPGAKIRDYHSDESDESNESAIERKRVRAGSMPMIPMGSGVLAPVPDDWHTRRAYSEVSIEGQRQISLVDFLKDICNEEYESELEYKVKGTGWRSGHGRLIGFELTIKDVQKESHHISLSIVVDLSNAMTQLVEKDQATGLFTLQTNKGTIELRNHRRFGIWVDLISRKLLIAKKLH
eukprot:Blabericola_migrator_1__1757@NODE_1474_length_4481_cov_83_008156_g969_i0_p3_GENE_NODE_1474_length_4481_cov_83_008156_g969_i0NODE_1474_length_4481_cov_83_008156_g969_i0_p3_ORF_typecomplete_len231_score43_23PH_2/PF08458_10/0_0062ProRSC_2/PF09181_10/0_13DUF1770/PF08589_10/4_8PRCH/PF03967_13/0_27_NODE_1474_length_4481_cov_83_008156_g969_i029873679